MLADQTDDQLGDGHGDEHDRKRKRVNTGSVDTETFSTTTNNEKLDVIFSKLINIEHKQTQIENLESIMQSSCESIIDIQSTTKTHNNMLRLLKYKSLDIEARSRRKNLIFRGLFEHRGENCTELILDFLYDQLQFEEPDLVTDRAHRLGSRQERA